MQLPGAPQTDAQQFWNSQMSVSSLLGLSPGAARGGAGDQLPPSSHAGGDNGAVPWSPDSPIFWLVAFGVLTVAGITGASVRVRAGHTAAGVDVGKTTT